MVAARTRALLRSLELDAAGRVTGELALALAKQIDAVDGGGAMMLPSLSKELRAVLATLAASEGDQLLARLGVEALEEQT